MAETVSFGMLGCGEIAVATARSLAAARHCRIALVQDVREAPARDLAEKHDARWTLKAEEVFADPEVEVVYIAVPHFLHAPLTIQALEAGKHVLVEKPMATTVADCDRMIAAARANDRVLSLAFLRRYQATTLKARELIEQGALGEIFGLYIPAMGDKPASYWQGGYSGRVQTDWRQSKERADGGILIMNAVHNLDALLWVTGLRAASVFSQYGTFTTPVEVEDFLSAIVRFGGGAIGTIEAGSAIPGRGGSEDRIYGTQGQIAFGFGKTLRVFTRRQDLGLTPNEWHELTPAQETDSRTALVEDFAGRLLAGKPPAIPPEAGRAVQQIICGAYQAGESGVPTTLAE